MATTDDVDLDLTDQLISAERFEEILLQGYIDDFKAIRGPVVGSATCSSSEPTKAATLEWFVNALNAKQIIFDGTVQQTHEVLLDNVSLLLGLSSRASNDGLLFTSDPAARKAQFIDDTGNGHAGYYDKIGGQIFALKSGPNDAIPLKDFLALVAFPLATWLEVPLSAMTVTPRTPSEKVFPKSGIWFQPGLDLSTTLRLEMQALSGSSNDSGFHDLIRSFFPRVELAPLIIIGRKAVQLFEDNVQESLSVRSELLLQTSMTWLLGEETMTLELFAIFNDEGVEFKVQMGAKDKNPWTALMSWLQGLLKDSGSPDHQNMDTSILQNAFASLGESLVLRQISLTVGKDRRLSAFSADFETELRHGAPTGKHVSLLSSFAWTPGRFTLNSEIFCPLSLRVFSIPRSLNPFWEAHRELEPKESATAIDYISLPHMFDSSNPITGIPAGLPVEVLDARVSVNLGDGVSVSIQGILECDPDEAAGNVPSIQFDRLSLAASFNSKKPKEYSLSMEGNVILHPATTPNQTETDVGDDIILRTIVSKDTDGLWFVGATVGNLRVAHLEDFFDAGSTRRAVMELMGGLQLRNLEISYSYSSSQPSSFTLGATLLLGPVALKLNYEHLGKTWLFSANFSPSDASSHVTIGDLLRDVVEDISSIPGFVTSVEIPLNKLSIELKCYRAGDNSELLVFSISMIIGNVYVSFVQIKDHTATGTQKTPAPKPLRILRFALNNLPTVDRVPLLTRLEQPFDQMDFVWLSQDASEVEVGLVNKYTFPKEAQLMFKKGSRKPALKTEDEDGLASSKTGEPEAPALAAGSHFQILVRDEGGSKVALDYVFGKPAPAPAPSTKTDTTSSMTGTLPRDNAAGTTATTSGASGSITSEAPSPLAPMEKKQGLLSISNVGLKLEKEVLHVILDAIVRLGPLEFMVKGLALLLHLEGFSLHNWQSIKLEVEFSGLGIEVKGGKFLLAGLFERIKDDTQVGFAGGMSIAMEPYAFSAAGAYLEQASGFKSVFAFAMLRGPLMDFGWAQIRGITGGFGYNSTIRLPDVTQVKSFPLMSDALPASSDPLQQLAALTDTSGDAWIKPLDKTIWIAAGLTIKALQLLDVQAVLTVELGDDLKIGLIGEAVAALPKGDNVDPDHLFLVIDLEIAASLDVGKGTLKIEAQISPASFILSHACHPVGGFALFAWFGNSEHAGDWVFSVGGFHPAYQRPSHYPNPPRLGISWTYDSHLTITGGAYFAITPQMCMGGAQLSAIFELGSISANFDAHADMLMNYQPFHYDVDIGVTMNVRYELKIVFVTVKFSVHAGATVKINGPPMAGSAHIDLSVINFTIAFGSPPLEPKALTLTEFWNLVKQSSALDASQPDGDHVMAASAGLLPSKDEGPDFLGVFRAGSLNFQVHSRAPLSAASYTGKDAIQGEEIYAKPMRKNTPLNSVLKVTITRFNEDGSISAQKFGFRQEAIEKPVPVGLWTQYDKSKDPADEGDNASALSSPATPLIKRLTGISIQPPKPDLSPEDIKPFAADDLMKSTMHNSNEIKLLDEGNGHFICAKDKASKDRLRGLWDQTASSALVNVDRVVGTFAKGYGANNQDASKKYLGLPTMPLTRALKQFDRYYSGGAPSLTSGSTTSEDRFKGFVLGQCSTKEQSMRNEDKQTVSRRFPLPSIYSSSQQHLTKGIIGLNKIDIDGLGNCDRQGLVTWMSSELEAPYHEFNVSSPKGSKIDDVNISWIDSVGDDLVQVGYSWVGNPASELLSPLKKAFPRADWTKGGFVTRRGLLEGGFRETSEVSLDFSEPKFSQPPQVIVFLTGFSDVQSTRLKIKLTVKEISTTRFKCWVSTSTNLAEDFVVFNWLAYPSGHPNLDSSTFRTAELPREGSPIKNISGDLVMSKPEFMPGQRPKVIAGFNEIDVSSRETFRTQVEVKDVTHRGFRWSLCSWGDSEIYNAGITWAALCYDAGK